MFCTWKVHRTVETELCLSYQPQQLWVRNVCHPQSVAIFSLGRFRLGLSGSALCCQLSSSHIWTFSTSHALVLPPHQGTIVAAGKTSMSYNLGAIIRQIMVIKIDLSF